MCGFGSASSLYPRVLINCFPVHCGHFFLDSTGIYWSSTIVYASATIHQSRLQVTNVGDKSPTPATSHRSLLQFTNVGYNSPTLATTHQCRLQFTNVGYNSPKSATTHQCQPSVTNVQPKETVTLCGMISTILQLLHYCSKLGFSVNIKRATYLLEQESATSHHEILQCHSWAYVQRKW